MVPTITLPFYSGILFIIIHDLTARFNFENGNINFIGNLSFRRAYLQVVTNVPTNSLILLYPISKHHSVKPLMIFPFFSTYLRN